WVHPYLNCSGRDDSPFDGVNIRLALGKAIARRQRSDFRGRNRIVSGNWTRFRGGRKRLPMQAQGEDNKRQRPGESKYCDQALPSITRGTHTFEESVVNWNSAAA